MIDEPIVAGSTYYWELIAYKDDVIWDISGATVTHYIKNPEGIVTAYSATISNGTAGTAYHINATTVLNTRGTWAHSWKVSLSGIVVESAFEEFTVHKSLAALA